MSPRSPAERGALDRLRFHLDMQDGFWFALVVGDDPRPRARLRAAAERDASRFFLHRVGPGDLVALAMRLASDPREGLHWVVADGPGATAGEWLDAAGDALQAMNERREAFRRHVPAGVVFEGRERLKKVLRTRAPDLFSIRACILEPGAQLPERVVEPSAADWLEPYGWSPSEVEEGRPWTWEGLRLIPDAGDPEEPVSVEVERVLQPARRLEGRSEEGARRSRVGALARAVEALRTQGWLTEAAGPAGDLRALAQELCADEEVPGWAHGMLALAWEALGDVHRAAGDVQAATVDLRRARELRESLVVAVVDPAMTAASWRGALDHATGWARWPAVLVARLDDLAAVLDDLAAVARSAGELDDAELRLAEAADIRGRAVVHGGRTPTRMSDLAVNLSLQGQIALQRGDPARAEVALHRALEVRRAVLAEDPDDGRFRRLVAIGLGRLSAALLAAGDVAGARERAEEGLRAARELAESDAGNVSWQVDLSVAWSRLGDVARAEGALAEASDAYARALLLRRRLVDEDPENARWQSLLAVALGRRGEVDRRRGDVAEAERSIREAVELSRQLVWQDPANAEWRRGLAASIVQLAEVLDARGEDSEALRSEAEELRREPAPRSL